jgi:hypothetical protein
MGMMKPSNDKEAITLILQGLQDKGWRCLMVQDDDMAAAEDNVLVNSVEEAVNTITAVDIATAYLYKNGNKPPSTKDECDGYVWFVQGNDPEEVAADYTVNVDEIISSITEPWW